MNDGDIVSVTLTPNASCIDSDVSLSDASVGDDQGQSAIVTVGPATTFTFNGAPVAAG